MSMGYWTNILIGIFTEAKTELFKLIGVAATLRIAWLGFRYKSATEDERNEIKKDMRNTVGWVFGIFIVVWLVGYIYTKASGAPGL